MHVDRRFLNWGVFFILLGLVPLAVRLGWVEAGSVAGWWRLWPLILIGIGAGLLLRRTLAAFAGGLIVAATFGLVFGSLIAGGVDSDFSIACADGRSGTAFLDRSGTFAGTGTVSLDVGCGDLTVRTASGAGWTLSGSAPGGREPRVEASADRLTIRSADRGFVGPFGLSSEGETWVVALPTEPTLALTATVNAGQARYDLSGAHLSSVSMTTNAGSVTVDLTGATLDSMSYTLNAGSTKISLPAASFSGTYTVNAGSLALCAPAGVGLRISTNDNFIASNNFAERGLVKSGSIWTTPGYDSASARIDLSATANVGRIALDPEGGCR